MIDYLAIFVRNPNMNDAQIFNSTSAKWEVIGKEPHRIQGRVDLFLALTLTVSGFLQNPSN